MSRCEGDEEEQIYRDGEARLVALLEDNGMNLYRERQDMGVGECHRGSDSLSRVCGGRGRYPDNCLFGA